MTKILLLLILASAVQAQSLYRISVASAIAASAADLATSMQPGRIELNPLLATDGRLQAKGAAVKSALTAVMLVASWQLYRHGHRRAATILNFTGAGAWGAVAAQNIR